ncbi:metal-dependent hydrolase [Sporosarcina sp. Marseille-Q4063]|uniref:metal-dependent hydrolase n=1 Tax=Sporosarcina sp. Marseille-Q4063 TaxID=2810514 RepID=UPI001BAE9405|nr:metal-dependent hydrolase [Sporosarcina sp. Marseille-Q4063]QUW23621.1 metal-dependent hydrolase [Sporosarcina sp. Marseille-Q4063]
MGYWIHTLLHFVVGGSIIYLLCNKDFESKMKRCVLILFGGLAGISPDFTKYFGDILGHSVLSAPVFGLLFGIGYFAMQKEISFMKAWFMFTLTVLIGHLFIDYIGNGVALFYPMIQKEFGFSIVGSNDSFILFTLLITIIIGIFYRKGKLVVLTGILVVSLYLGGLSFSKIQLQQTLEKQYENDNINLLLTFPSHRFLNWEFMVKTDKSNISGYSPILGGEIKVYREKINK